MLKLRLNTLELKANDIVCEYGMRVRLDGTPNVYHNHNGSGLETRSWCGTVLNMHEVETAGFVPLSFLRTRKWEDGTGWVVDRDDVWHVQGNSLAVWNVERTETSHYGC